MDKGIHNILIYGSSKVAITPKLNIGISLRIKDYLKENWGAPFIIVFMILLTTAAVYLALGDEANANNIAVYAYYSLVIGVFLQLICFIKYGREED